MAIVALVSVVVLERQTLPVCKGTWMPGNVTPARVTSTVAGCRSSMGGCWTGVGHGIDSTTATDRTRRHRRRRTRRLRRCFRRGKLGPLLRGLKDGRKLPAAINPQFLPALCWTPMIPPRYVMFSISILVDPDAPNQTIHLKYKSRNGSTLCIRRRWFVGSTPCIELDKYFLFICFTFFQFFLVYFFETVCCACWNLSYI